MTRIRRNNHSISRRRFATALALGMLSTVALTAGTSAVFAADEDLAKLVEAAKKEGELVLYSSESEKQTADLNKAFEAKYGIKIQATRLGAGALATRYAGERQGNVIVADVVVTANEPLFTDNPTWWVPLNEQVLPELVNFPKQKIGKGFVTVTHNVVGITWNTNLVKGADEPKSYMDLVNNPLFAKKGSIVYADPRAAPSSMSLFKLQVDKFGEEFFKKLMDRGVVIAASNLAGIQQVAAGANLVVIGAFANNTLSVQAAGGPVKYAQVLDPLTGVDGVVALSTNAKHPNAARLYANFRISKEGQTLMCLATGASSPIGDFPGCEPAADAAKYVPTDWNITKAWQDKYLPLLGLKPL